MRRPMTKYQFYWGFWRINSSVGCVVLPLLVRWPDGPSDFVVSTQACLEHDARDKLSSIRSPTLVLGGTTDQLFPTELFREVAEAIPHAQLQLIRRQRARRPYRAENHVQPDRPGVSRVRPQGSRAATHPTARIPPSPLPKSHAVEKDTRNTSRLGTCFQQLARSLLNS